MKRVKRNEKPGKNAVRVTGIVVLFLIAAAVGWYFFKMPFFYSTSMKTCEKKQVLKLLDLERSVELHPETILHTKGDVSLSLTGRSSEEAKHLLKGVDVDRLNETVMRYTSASDQTLGEVSGELYVGENLLTSFQSFLNVEDQTILFRIPDLMKQYVLFSPGQFLSKIPVDLSFLVSEPEDTSFYERLYRIIKGFFVEKASDAIVCDYIDVFFSGLPKSCRESGTVELNTLSSTVKRYRIDAEEQQLKDTAIKLFEKLKNDPAVREYLKDTVRENGGDPDRAWDRAVLLIDDAIERISNLPDKGRSCSLVLSTDKKGNVCENVIFLDSDQEVPAVSFRSLRDGDFQETSFQVAGTCFETYGTEQNHQFNGTYSFTDDSISFSGSFENVHASDSCFGGAEGSFSLPCRVFTSLLPDELTFLSEDTLVIERTVTSEDTNLVSLKLLDGTEEEADLKWKAVSNDSVPVTLPDEKECVPLSDFRKALDLWKLPLFLGKLSGLLGIELL